MECFTGAERAFCVRILQKHWFCDFSATKVSQSLRDINEAPSAQLIKNWVQKFEETGSTLNKPRTGRPRSSRTEENVESVRISVRENPALSVRKRARAVNVLRSSLHRILRKDLCLHPYKIQLVQELKPTDGAQRLNFVNEMFERFPSFNNINWPPRSPDLTPVGIPQVQSLQ